MLHRKKENFTVCSSINWPSNLVNNVFVSVHYVDFNIKLLFFLTEILKSFPDFMSKTSKPCWAIFFTEWWGSEEKWFWLFKHFSKLKMTLCEYWISIKIKISMICVLKEYKIESKMVQKQWLQLKMTFLLDCNLTIFI